MTLKKFLFGALILCGPSSALAAAAKALPLEGALNSLADPQRLSSVFETVAVLTAVSLIPSALILMTSFLRFIIVLGLLRQALSLQQTPPNHVLISLALVLTCFVMAPTLKEINTVALRPYQENKLPFPQAIEKAGEPVRKFLLHQTRRRELAFMVKLARVETPKSEQDVPFLVLVTAFVLSELKTAFTMGFLIFLPFLVIDLGVSSVLMSLGMMMVPPSMVSLPLKILLFVMVDGWTLLVEGLVRSVR